ncbi:hypothetical protein [Bacteroides thetaiotaomicron]|uniref:hypothetical protein n=1 Tax=Bacteroides thetaiotaomicron TaxID=818 RepID=UPI003DA56E3A
MKIPIDRNKRIILLKWLDRGIINTDDLPIEDNEEEWVTALKALSIRYREEDKRKEVEHEKNTD